MSGYRYGDTGISMQSPPPVTYLPPDSYLLLSEARLSLSEVYLPVMRMISESPLSSPLHAINTNNLSDFILQLTRPPESNVSLTTLSLILLPPLTLPLSLCVSVTMCCVCDEREMSLTFAIISLTTIPPLPVVLSVM